MKGIQVSVKPNVGSRVETVCDSVKVLSEFINSDIEFEFNGVKITTKNKSIKEMIESYYVQR